MFPGLGEQGCNLRFVTHPVGVKCCCKVRSEEPLLLCSQLCAPQSLGMSRTESWSSRGDQTLQPSVCPSALSNQVPCTANARTCKHKREDWPFESSFLSFDLGEPFIPSPLPLVLCLISLTSLCNLDLVPIHKAREGKCNLWRGCFPLPNHLQLYPSLFLLLWFFTFIFLANCHQWTVVTRLGWEDGPVSKISISVEHKLLSFTGCCMSCPIDSPSPVLGEKEDNNTWQISHLQLHFLCFLPDQLKIRSQLFNMLLNIEYAAFRPQRCVCSMMLHSEEHISDIHNYSKGLGLATISLL